MRSSLADILAIQKFDLSELAISRDEPRGFFKADLEGIVRDIQRLSERINNTERSSIPNISAGVDDIQGGVSSVSVISEEDIIAEMSKRENRSANLIPFNLNEMNGDNSTEARNHDRAAARDVLTCILPDNFSSKFSKRIGSKRPDRPRPLRIGLGSEEEEVVCVSKNRSRYSGPVRISQDQTRKQRAHLQNLEAKLKSMIDSGDESGKIKYFNGIPKIVSANPKKK